MTIEDIQSLCSKFPGVTQDIKWENHLCFCVSAKIFIMIGMDDVPLTASFKASDEDFELLSNRNGFKPAPYMGRNKWIWTEDINLLSREEWEHYARKSYEIIKSKLPKKVQAQLNESDSPERLR
jgi:predicted DNA-binding protein (MmcQ/YjbR family)